MSLSATPYLMLAALLFTIGALGLLIRRNVLVMFMCVELMLNAVNLTFVSFARELDDVGGQVAVFFVLVVAAAEVAQVPTEGDERQVDGVEPELDAHEHHQRVAADEQPDGTQREQDRGEHEVPGRRDRHREDHASTSLAWAAASASSSACSAREGRLARTTAPTTAMVRSSEVISKANT